MIAQTPGQTWVYVLERERSFRVLGRRAGEEGSGDGDLEVLERCTTREDADAAAARLAKRPQLRDVAVEERPPARPASRFTLQAVPNRVRMALVDALRQAEAAPVGELMLRRLEAFEMALRAGLRGWGNVVNGSGIQVAFEVAEKPTVIGGVECIGPSDATIGMLHPDDVVELAQAVLAGNRLREEEIPN